MKTTILAIAVAGTLGACAPLHDLHMQMMGGQHQEHMEGEHHDGMYRGDDHAAHYAQHHASDIDAAINAPDRPEAHRTRDENRHPEVSLAFSQIEPGSRVMDVGSGSGYFTMLLSGLVGPEGHVTGVNAPAWEERYGANWPEAQAAMQETRGNVEFTTVPLDDLGVAPGSYDAITLMLNYHDTVLLPLDRGVMNRGFYDALRPGGLLLLSDNSAPDGTGIETTETLHRIDQAVVRAELEAAGFELIAVSDGLRNPEDDRSLFVFNPEIRGGQDKFLMLFRKPE